MKKSDMNKNDRFCFKLIPIEFATKAALETFEEQVKKMIEKKFKPGVPKKVFGFNIQILFV